MFPLKPGLKTPACAHGVDDATRDEAQIRTWWKKMPNANIGVAGGVIVDIDEGCASLEDVERFMLLRGLTETLIIRTGRRTSFGAQIHYSGTAPNGPYDINSVKGEVRSAGYYGIWAGSIHESGEKYMICMDRARAPWPETASFGLKSRRTVHVVLGGDHRAPFAASAKEDYLPTTIENAREAFEEHLLKVERASTGRNPTAHACTWYAARAFAAGVFDHLEVHPSLWPNGIEPFPAISERELKDRIMAAASKNYKSGERDLDKMIGDSWRYGKAAGALQLKLSHDDFRKLWKLADDAQFQRAFDGIWAKDFASPKAAADYLKSRLQSVGFAEAERNRLLGFSEIGEEVAAQLLEETRNGELR